MSLMAAEAREAPDAAARFLDRNAAALAELGARLRRSEPAGGAHLRTRQFGQCRGLSSNISARSSMGVPCASVGASVVSVYGGRLKAR